MVESIAGEDPRRIAVLEMAGAAGAACFGRDPFWFTQHFVPSSKVTDSCASGASHDDLPLLEEADDESKARDCERLRRAHRLAPAL